MYNKYMDRCMVHVTFLEEKRDKINHEYTTTNSGKLNSVT